MAIINPKIIAWAKLKIGQKVGRGQCWDLVEQAVTGSGGTGSGKLGPLGDDADYVWGARITPSTAAVAGDILQFRNFEQSSVAVSKVTYLDTTPPTVQTETDDPQTLKYPHHSAIIESISGGQAILLEQNADPSGELVQRSGAVFLTTVTLPPVTSVGTRALVNEKGKPLPPAKVLIETTTTVTVTNPPIIYRAG